MKFILSCLFIFITFTSFSQDLIIKLDSSKVFCNILKEDSSTIYFKAKKGEEVVEQSIKKSEVLSYSNSKAIVQKQIKKADSVAHVKPKFKDDYIVFNVKTKFTYHDRRYGNHAALILMKDDAEAHAEMKKAINCNLFNIFTTSVAVSTLAAFTADAIVLSKPEWPLAGVGAGTAVLSFALTYFYHKHCTKAVDIYNSNLKTASTNIPKFEFGIASRGLGVSLKF